MGPRPPPAHPADALRATRGQHLQGKLVGLGVDAGPAAPSAVRVARELLRWGAEVVPLPVPGAEAWVPDAALHYAAGRPAVRFDPPELDALLLAPAGPGLLRKLHLGIADSAPLQAAARMRGRAPVLVAAEPAPDGMRAVHDALDAAGALHPEPLTWAVCAALSRSPLAGQRVLLIAGGAFEPLDAMRTVQRRGDAGVARAAADELRRRGAHVTLLLGPAAQARARHERAYDTLRDVVLMAPLLGRHDLLLAEDALPGLAPVAHAGKVPSGRADFHLDLHRAAQVLPELRRHAAHAIVYRPTPHGLELEGRTVPASGAQPQGRALADAAEGLV